MPQKRLLLESLSADINEGDNKVENSVLVGVLDYLNKVAGRNFKPVTSQLKFISGRLREGYTVDDMQAVVDFKTKEWEYTDFEMYLRPETLFSPLKFQGYLYSARNCSKKDKVREERKNLW